MKTAAENATPPPNVPISANLMGVGPEDSDLDVLSRSLSNTKAILDLLFLVACNGEDEMCEGTLHVSLSMAFAMNAEAMQVVDRIFHRQRECMSKVPPAAAA